MFWGCRFDTFDYQETIEWTDSDVSALANGHVNGVPFSNEFSMNWSDSPSFSLNNVFNGPDSVCVDSFIALEGVSNIEWSATQGERGLRSKLSINSNLFRAKGTGFFGEKFISIKLQTNLGNAEVKIKSFDDPLEYADRYGVNVKFGFGELKMMLPGAKRFAQIESAFDEQYGWIGEVAELLLEDEPLRNILRLGLWFDYASDELSDHFDCSSVFAATGIKVIFLGNDYAQSIPELCSGMNARAVAGIQEIADYVSPMVREELQDMLNPLSEQNISLKNQWQEILA